MSYTDAVARISAIESQIAALRGGGVMPPPAAATAATTPAGATAAPGATGAAPVSFASALSQAQGATLPAKATQMLTSGQQTFAARLAQQTGLDPGVISSWLLAEESGGAARSREAASNNNWLNIGYTDSGTYGASASVWSSPESAADATAAWLKGQKSVDGYGAASAGIRAIVATAGQSPQAQIAALQGSGWASSGYPDLPALYSQVTG
jgi:hypothetical protein